MPDSARHFHPPVKLSKARQVTSDLPNRIEFTGSEVTSGNGQFRLGTLTREPQALETRRLVAGILPEHRAEAGQPAVAVKGEERRDNG